MHFGKIYDFVKLSFVLQTVFLCSSYALNILVLHIMVRFHEKANGKKTLLGLRSFYEPANISETYIHVNMSLNHELGWYRSCVHIMCVLVACLLSKNISMVSSQNVKANIVTFA